MGITQIQKIELQNKYMGLASPQRRPQQLQKKGLETFARKFKKYQQVENILVHLQNTSIYYVNYKNEEYGVNALIRLIHKKGVARVVTTEERNANVSKIVTMEH